MIKSPHRSQTQDAASYGETKTLYAGVNPGEVDECLELSSGKLVAREDVGDSDYLWATEDLDIARSHSKGAIMKIEAHIAPEDFRPAGNRKQGYKADSYDATSVIGVYKIDDDVGFGEDLGDPDLEVESKWDLRDLSKKLGA